MSDASGEITLLPPTGDSMAAGPMHAHTLLRALYFAPRQNLAEVAIMPLFTHPVPGAGADRSIEALSDRRQS